MYKSGFPNQAAGFAYDMPMIRLFAVSYRCTATKDMKDLTALLGKCSIRKRV